MMMMKSTNQLMSESYLSFKNNINVGDANGKFLLDGKIANGKIQVLYNLVQLKATGMPCKFFW